MNSTQEVPGLVPSRIYSRSPLSANTTSYHPYPLPETLAGIAGAGFRYVELMVRRGNSGHVPRDADAHTLGAIQRQLNQNNLIAVSLSGHSDLTTHAGTIEGLRALEICQRLGISILNTYTGGHHWNDREKKRFLQNIHILADAAAQEHITIGIEVHGPTTGSGQTLAHLMDEIACANVGINYDTANCEFYGNVRAEDDLVYALPHLVHIHLKDTVGGQGIWNFPALGRGRVDFRRVLTQLRRAKYAGPLSVELEFRGEPWPSLRHVNQAMKASYRLLSTLVTWPGKHL